MKSTPCIMLMTDSNTNLHSPKASLENEVQRQAVTIALLREVLLAVAAGDDCQVHAALDSIERLEPDISMPPQWKPVADFCENELIWLASRDCQGSWLVHPHPVWSSDFCPGEWTHFLPCQFTIPQPPSNHPNIQQQALDIQAFHSRHHSQAHNPELLKVWQSALAYERSMIRIIISYADPSFDDNPHQAVSRIRTTTFNQLMARLA